MIFKRNGRAQRQAIIDGVVERMRSADQDRRLDFDFDPPEGDAFTATSADGVTASVSNEGLFRNKLYLRVHAKGSEMPTLVRVTGTRQIDLARELVGQAQRRSERVSTSS